MCQHLSLKSHFDETPGVKEAKMSEYQYYEFQAIDRPLSKKELPEIARLSRRVELTPYQAIITEITEAD